MAISVVTFVGIQPGSKIYKTIIRDGVRWFGRNITDNPGRWVPSANHAEAGYQVDYRASLGEVFFIVSHDGFLYHSDTHVNSYGSYVSQVSQAPMAFIGTGAYASNNLADADEIWGIVHNSQINTVAQRTIPQVSKSFKSVKT